MQFLLAFSEQNMYGMATALIKEPLHAPSALAGAFVPSSPFTFPAQLKPLKRDLRADRPFDPDDGKTVGDALSTLGVGEGDLFSSIKKFQKDHGLKVDGWMRPKGPTEKTLNAVLAGGIGAGIPQGKDKADWLTRYALPQDIVGFDFDKGEAGRNSPGDLMKVKRGFGALIPGKLGRLFEDQPDDFGETVEMIKAIQRGAGLKETGWFAPGDDTAKAYGVELKRKLPQLEDGRSDELAASDAGPSLWQRLRGERTPKDKSLFPKGYTNWREMRELGEVGSKRPHLVEALAEKNARSDLDYKIDANFRAERERIGGLALLRQASGEEGSAKSNSPRTAKPIEPANSQPSSQQATARSEKEKRRMADKEAAREPKDAEIQMPSDGTNPIVPLESTNAWADRGYGRLRGDFKPPVVSMKDDRIQSILNDTPAVFEIEDAQKDATYRPWHDVRFGTQMVVDNDSLIEEAAATYGVDPDLVRAIVFVENAEGWIDFLHEAMGENETQRPMNINPELWGDLVENGGDLKDPEKNILAGVILLKRIQDRVESPTVSKVAALYNNISLENVANNPPNNYGAWITRAYVEKPWLDEKNQGSFPIGLPR